MSTFGYSRAVQVLLAKSYVFRKSIFFLMKERQGFNKAWRFKVGRFLGYIVVPFLGQCDTLRGSDRALKIEVPFFDTFATA